MTFRKINTGTWQDPWFENLTNDGKLLFIYLWTNETCNQAGLYQITAKRILFDSGIDITKHQEELKEKAMWYPETNVVWVKNFFKHQCQNSKFAQAAIKSLDGLPANHTADFLIHNKTILNQYDTISIPYKISKIPYPTEQNRTDTEADTDSENKEETETESEDGFFDSGSDKNKNGSKKPSKLKVFPDGYKDQQFIKLVYKAISWLQENREHREVSAPASAEDILKTSTARKQIDIFYRNVWKHDDADILGLKDLQKHLNYWNWLLKERSDKAGCAWKSSMSGRWICLKFLMQTNIATNGNYGRAQDWHEEQTTSEGKYDDDIDHEAMKRIREMSKTPKCEKDTVEKLLMAIDQPDPERRKNG